MLLEADIVGGAATGGDTGLVREGFAGFFHEAAAAYGLRTTRALWEGMRKGGLEFAAALRRYEIRCDLAPAEILTFAARQTDAMRVIKREYQVRREAGVEGAWVSQAAVNRQAAFESGGALRTRGFTIDPYRASLGLAAAAGRRGARIYERSAVTRIRSGKKHVEIITAAGVVRAEAVIVATAAPIRDLRALRRHLRAEHVYGVVTEPLSAAVRRKVGARDAVLDETGGTSRVIRWLRDDTVFVQGGRQPVIAERGRERAVVQRTGQLMYELLLLYPDIVGLQPVQAWDAVDYETADGLPFVGPHRNFPRHFFAFGSSRHGAGLAWTAARLALRHVQGEQAKADEAFGFHRVL